jgi:hypothetical protein
MHATSEFRKEAKRCTEEELKYHVVEMVGVRLYILELPAPKFMDGNFMWSVFEPCSFCFLWIPHDEIAFYAQAAVWLLCHHSY